MKRILSHYSLKKAICLNKVFLCIKKKFNNSFIWKNAALISERVSNNFQYIFLNNIFMQLHNENILKIPFSYTDVDNFDFQDELILTSLELGYHRYQKYLGIFDGYIYNSYPVSSRKFYNYFYIIGIILGDRYFC